MCKTSSRSCYTLAAVLGCLLVQLGLPLAAAASTTTISRRGLLRGSDCESENYSESESSWMTMTRWLFGCHDSSATAEQMDYGSSSNNNNSENEEYAMVMSPLAMVGIMVGVVAAVILLVVFAAKMFGGCSCCCGGKGGTKAATASAAALPPAGGAGAAPAVAKTLDIDDATTDTDSLS